MEPSGEQLAAVLLSLGAEKPGNFQNVPAHLFSQAKSLISFRCDNQEQKWDGSPAPVYLERKMSAVMPFKRPYTRSKADSASAVAKS